VSHIGCVYPHCRYKYELCPFDKSTQHEGGRQTSLGCVCVCVCVVCACVCVRVCVMCVFYTVNYY